MRRLAFVALLVGSLSAQAQAADLLIRQARIAATIPVGRVGTPEDIAHAVSFFVDRRSGYVNGQVLYVAGGPRN